METNLVNLQRCPFCNSADISERDGIHPRYDCNQCHKMFDTPERMETTEQGKHTPAPDGLETAETTYLWMLIWLPLDIRCKAQAQLCSLRNFIASATGRTQEDVQDDFESQAAIAKAEGR